MGFLILLPLLSTLNPSGLFHGKRHVPVKDVIESLRDTVEILSMSITTKCTIFPTSLSLLNLVDGTTPLGTPSFVPTGVWLSFVPGLRE